MTNTSADLANITLEDIYDNPSRFGMPTFEEFRKDPEKYKGRHDELLALTDASSTVKQFRDVIEKQTYSCMGYDCGTSLEKVERIVKEEGYRVDQMDMVPRIYPQAGGKVEIRVEFVVKANAQKMVQA